MSQPKKIAFIGNHLPRRCGIATFTHDLHCAVASARPDLETCVVAMTDPGSSYDYPPAVQVQIRDDKIGEYVEAAAFLNDEGFDAVCLQHEYGIFGGEAGRNIIKLLSRLKMPLITTFHTVLPAPTPVQREVMCRIIDISSKTIVMSEKGYEFLRSSYYAPPHKIEIIPHGIPDYPFTEANHAKVKFGFARKTIILTFGLLSPSKGIETVINAMPEIVKSCPNALYVILGATHPNLVRHHGEAYRDSLKTRVEELGMEDHVVFFNQFVDQATLMDFISMCDVYVTPYLNEAQMTSGTLAYSFGLGKAVVSTPYWHAKELLNDGHGILVPFGDAKTLGAEVASLLTNEPRRQAMCKRAYAASRSMTWAQTAKRYLSVFETAHSDTRPKISLPVGQSIPRSMGPPIPEPRLEHFLSLCDGTGMLQHAVHTVQNRSHGYCVDDNARALLLAISLLNSGEAKLTEAMTGRFAAFIQHAWNSDTGRFRNFMSYDRRWLDESGSEDSHGRALWALAECARNDKDSFRCKWAAALFKTALPAVEAFTSPRAWAFSLLGLDNYCTQFGGDLFARRVRKQLADKLLALVTATESNDWVWFEDVLAYDNARLSQALIQTGMTTDTPVYVDAGLRSLRWLMAAQTAPAGYFRPVGTKSFGRLRQKPHAFDQQPVEAAATISACLAAWQVHRGLEWEMGAMRALGWFLGENDLFTPLIDSDTGSCSDGLHPDRPNENKGAESALSYLLGLMEVRAFKRAVKMDRTNSAAKLMRNIVSRPIAPRTIPGSYIAPIQILKSTKSISAPGSNAGRGQTVQAGD